MTNIEIAEAIKNTDMYELACKTVKNINLSDSEASVVAQLDEHFKDVGKRGVDADNEIASFIQKIVTREIYEAPDDLLDLLFTRGNIGEFDDFETVVDPKNTLTAYETAKGGNVKKSFLDATVLTPEYHNYQIETDISYADLERGGWKTVAKYTEFAVAEFKNKMFKSIFEKIGNGITNGSDNYITVGGTAMNQTATDAVALYVNDRADGDGTIVCQSKYAQQISKLTGFNSQEMLNEIHRTGCLGVYDGCSLTPISSAKKLGDGSAIFPNKRVFGVAGKIGELNMKGDIKVYETMNNDSESVHLKFAGFTFGVTFNTDTLEKVAMAVIS